MPENNYFHKKYDLDRFLEAQKISYDIALTELKGGYKRSHWMWYIFPQLKGLGYSTRAKYYGIENIEEAIMYMAHPVLSERLYEISETLLQIDNSDPYDVMGEIDGEKLCSSMTLFAEVVGYDSVFGRVLEKFYGGNRDINTVIILNKQYEEKFNV